MPPKGFVGIHLTAQRKLLLAELMKQEDFAKPTNAIDFAVALAQEYVNADAEEVGETGLPEFVNYYVGDVAPFEPSENNKRKGQKQDGALVARTNENKSIVSGQKVTWRMDGLNIIRNYEPTITNLADAVDFALMTALVHLRAGTVTSEHKDEIKKQVAQNAVQFKEILTEFRSENMDDKRATNPANIVDKELARKVKGSKKHSKKRDAEVSLVGTSLFYAYKEFHKYTTEGNLEMAAGVQKHIDELIVQADKAERTMRTNQLLEMARKAKGLRVGEEAKHYNETEGDKNGNNPIDF